MSRRLSHPACLFAVHLLRCSVCELRDTNLSKQAPRGPERQAVWACSFGHALSLWLAASCRDKEDSLIRLGRIEPEPVAVHGSDGVGNKRCAVKRIACRGWNLTKGDKTRNRLYRLFALDRGVSRNVFRTRLPGIAATSA